MITKPVSLSIDDYILQVHDLEMSSKDPHEKAGYAFLKRIASAYMDAVDTAEGICGSCAGMHAAQWLGILFASFTIDRIKPGRKAEAFGKAALDFQDAVFDALKNEG